MEDPEPSRCPHAPGFGFISSRIGDRVLWTISKKSNVTVVLNHSH